MGPGSRGSDGLPGGKTRRSIPWRGKVPRFAIRVGHGRSVGTDAGRRGKGGAPRLGLPVYQRADKARTGGDFSVFGRQVAEQLNPRRVHIGNGGQVQAQGPAAPAPDRAGAADAVHPGHEEFAFELDRQAPLPGEKSGNLEHACRLLVTVGEGKANRVPVDNVGAVFCPESLARNGLQRTKGGGRPGVVNRGRLRASRHVATRPSELGEIARNTELLDPAPQRTGVQAEDRGGAARARDYPVGVSQDGDDVVALHGLQAGQGLARRLSSLAIENKDSRADALRSVARSFASDSNGFPEH